MYILILSILYTTPNGVLYKHETVDGFKTEKACLEHKNIEDRHLKRIKAQTNIKEWSMDCVKGG
jgi:hypothetical protein